jgi:endonuclease YncB( thermonuclease family)
MFIFIISDNAVVDSQILTPLLPYSYEAREFLIENLLGRVVLVEVEYTRVIPNNNYGITEEDDDDNAREYCTIFIDGENVNYHLVHEGLARTSMRKIIFDKNFFFFSSS